MNQLESPGHSTVRRFLRIAGPILVLVGLIFMAIGLISFFSAFGTFQPPRRFWCCFVGLPILAIGGMMCQFGYIGAVARYVASESAPVAKDTVNYMAEGTKDAVKTVAKSIAEGVQEARQEKKNS
jgi:hypothetical protein